MLEQARDCILKDQHQHMCVCRSTEHDSSYLLDEVHPHGGGQDPVYEAIGDVAPVVW
jgi:hypothetical protein